jgi:hypothetical protein
MSASDCKATDFLKFVQTSNEHAYVIQDVSVLPHNKKALLDAIYWRLRMDFRKMDVEVLSTLARSLATYQEGVGSDSVYFTDTSEAGLKLKLTMNEELSLINAELSCINKTRDESHEKFEQQYDEHINRHSKGTSLYAYGLILIVCFVIIGIPLVLLYGLVMIVFS